MSKQNSTAAPKRRPAPNKAPTPTTTPRPDAAAQKATDQALEKLRALGDLASMAGGSDLLPANGTLTSFGDLILCTVADIDESLRAERRRLA